MLSVPSFSSLSEILAFLSCIPSNPALKSRVLSSLAPSLEQSIGISYPLTKDLTQSLNVPIPQKLSQQNFNGALSLGLLQTQGFQQSPSVVSPGLNINSLFPLKRPNILLYQNPQAAQYNSVLTDYMKKGGMLKKDEPKPSHSLEQENIPKKGATTLEIENSRDKTPQPKKKRVQESFKRQTEPKRALKKLSSESSTQARVSRRTDANTRYPIRNKIKEKQTEKEEAKLESQNFEFNTKTDENNTTVPSNMEKKDYDGYVMNLNISSDELAQVPQSRIGEEYQAATPEVSSETFHRTIKGLWNPEKISEGQLTSYFDSLNHYLGQEYRNYVKALNLLERFEYNVERTLENVRKNKTYYRKQLGLEGNKYQLY